MNNMIGPNGLFQINRLRQENNRTENIHSIRSLATSCYQGGNVSTCRVLGHYIMFVSTLDERLGVQLQMNGFWEMNVTEFIARNVTEGMTVLDVGANYGYYSMLMSTLVGQTGSVTAIDANPILCEFILKSSKVNGFENKLKIINQGISDKTDSNIDFAYSDDTPMNGLISSQITETAQKKFYPNLIKVNVDSIDETFKEYKTIDFMKVDIEGFEDKFWYGSKEIRSKNPQLQILMEFNRSRYQNVDQFIDNIYSEGYQVTKLSHFEKGYEDVTAEYLKKSATDHHMMLALKKINS
jgi:FkbM family methyltransferase